MKLSIVLLSRKRPALLRNLLQSLRKSTLRPNLLDIIIGMDTDDEEYLKSADKIEQDYNCTAMFRPRQSNMHKYINLLARASLGDFVMVLNDDCEINTCGWDDAIRSEIKDQLGKWPDGIFYIRTKDNSVDKVGGAEYASFPMISRKAIDAAGIFMDPTFPYHGADVSTWRIYDSVNRVYKTECFEVNHLLHASSEILQKKDETAVRMIQGTFSNRRDYWTSDISMYTNRLKDAL